MKFQYRLLALTTTVAAAMLVPLALTSCASPESTSSTKQPASRSSAASAETAPVEAFQATKLTEEPIIGVGHGAIMTAEGSVAEPSLAFIRRAQAYYIERLVSEGGQRVRADLDALRRARSSEYEGKSEVAKSGEEIAWLLERVGPDDAATLASINAFLLEKGAPEAGSSEALDLQPLFIGTLSAGDAYVEQCEEAGVPIPPPWGSEEWVYRGRMDSVLISTNLSANVYVAESFDPLGVCIALPRRRDDGGIPLFGVICQGAETNKACFWDNAPRLIDPSNVGSLTSGNFIGGAELDGKAGGVCTDCHRGENIFIVHPGSPLDLTRPTKDDPEPRGGASGRPTQYAKGWVEPLVHPDWPDNPEPVSTLTDVELDMEGSGENAPDGSCLTCHNAAARTRLGELSGGYCGVIRLSLLSGMMPPPSYLENVDPNISFYKHVNAIEEACGGGRITFPPFVVSSDPSDEEIFAP